MTWGVREIGEGDEEVQTSTYETSNPWGHSKSTVAENTVITLYGGNHLVRCAHGKSACNVPGASLMSYINYITIV